MMEPNLPAALLDYSGRDICPIMSIGQVFPAQCTPFCAWYDESEKICNIVRIGGQLERTANELHFANP